MFAKSRSLSNGRSADPALWREKFYDNQGWHIRPEYFEQARKNALTRDRSESILYSTPTRPRRSTTVASEGSIASRLGRRLGEIVNEMGYLTFYGRTSAEKPLRETSPLPPVTSTVAEAAHCVPTAPLMQSRSRSNTNASQTSYFAFPSRTLGRLHTAPAGALAGPSTMSRSRNATLTSQADHPGDLQADDGDVSTLLPGAVPNGSFTQLSGRQRSHSGKALSAFQVSSPIFEMKDDAVLSLDWKGLYRDRLELERRWDDGKFAKRILKGHKANLLNRLLQPIKADKSLCTCVGLGILHPFV